MHHYKINTSIVPLEILNVRSRFQVNYFGKFIDWCVIFRNLIEKLGDLKQLVINWYFWKKKKHQNILHSCSAYWHFRELEETIYFFFHANYNDHWLLNTQVHVYTPPDTHAHRKLPSLNSLKTVVIKLN